MSSPSVSVGCSFNVFTYTSPFKRYFPFLSPEHYLLEVFISSAPSGEPAPLQLRFRTPRRLESVRVPSPSRKNRFPCRIRFTTSTLVPTLQLLYFLPVHRLRVPRSDPDRSLLRPLLQPWFSSGNLVIPFSHSKSLISTMLYWTSKVKERRR